MTVRWGSLLTTPDGEVDPARLKTFAAVLLALLGGLVLVAGAVLEMWLRVEIPYNIALLSAGVLVAPLTGGTVASAWAARKYGAVATPDARGEG